MQQRPQTLSEIESAVWDELERCVDDRGHPWRVAVLATADGGGVDARTVVLRGVDRDLRELLLYTDARAAKVAQMQQRPDSVLVMWSQRLLWQLRLAVAVTVETSGLAVSSRWARLALSAGPADYISPRAPDAPPDRPQPLRASRDHFAVATAAVRRIDWLELNAEGHRRAIFADGPARWAAP